MARPFRTLLVVVVSAVLLPSPIARAYDGEAIAIVQGQPIDRSKMMDLLMDAYGLNILQQMVALELAKAESKRLGLTVTAADVDAEYRDSINRIAAGARASEITDDERRQALEKMLDEKGISFVEFMMSIERNTHLRKVIEKQLIVDQKALEEEFARSYGEKVEIRVIQTKTLERSQLAIKQLQAGGDFAEVAKAISENAASAAGGGLLDPFAYTDRNVPAELREVAFDTKIGDATNPIKTQFGFYVLKVERRIPPENVKFEDVRATVEKLYRENAVMREREKELLKLFEIARKQGKIRILDERLSAKYDQLLKKSAGQP